MDRKNRYTAPMRIPTKVDWFSLFYSSLQHLGVFPPANASDHHRHLVDSFNFGRNPFVGCCWFNVECLCLFLSSVRSNMSFGRIMLRGDCFVWFPYEFISGVACFLFCCHRSLIFNDYKRQEREGCSKYVVTFH